ncbi:MAG: hypothetical protein IJ547_06675 [Clostridia bacterium]|nr:hypothetical protein [Clostridia bacterium]MBQ8470254.1 hypothetical protein [Clostridia bacterium]
MTQSKERQVLIWTGVASLVLTIVFFALTVALGRLDRVLEPFFLFFLGLGCQCGIRLLLTTRWNYDHDRLFVTTSGWFQKNKLDKAVLKRDPVCRWADLTGFDPENFGVRPGERELVVQHTCTLEIINSLNAVLAFLPLLMLLTADHILLSLVIFLLLGLAFSAWSLYTVMRARQFRFQVKAGRY